MTRAPDFDELLDADLATPERERLHRVHDLLVAAGPPPELSPELEHGPALALTLRRRERRPRALPARRSLLLAAAVVVLVGAFFAGYASGNKPGSSDALRGGWVVRLHATGGVGAEAAIRVGTRDEAGNWPMHIVATGLPRLPKGGYYEVFLTRNGRTVGPCGSFIAHGGDADAYLNAPYRLAGAGWVVTAQQQGDHERGHVVLTT